MTAQESVYLLRMLLDEGRDDYVGLSMALNLVNEAQMRKVAEYYNTNNERALRPLYRRAGWLTDGDTLQAHSAVDLLYPCSMQMRTSGQAPETEYRLAHYVEYDRYFNLNNIGLYVGGLLDQSLYWTYHKQYQSGSYNTVVNFVDMAGGVFEGLITYICVPPTFVYNPLDQTSNVDLSVSDEYHVNVITEAAELINTIDVGELERGEGVVVQPGSTIRLRDIMNI